jgi:hypothetical protein
MYADRQAFLLANWGFTCTCVQCSISKSKRDASDKRLARYQFIRDRYIGHENAENWEILGFQDCWTQIREGIRLLESEQRYNEVADCWESLFHMSVGWGELTKALDAGKGWIAELARTGEFLEGDELMCVKDPENLDEWYRFVNVAEAEVSVPSYMRRWLMSSLCPNQKAMVKTISNLTGLPPKGVVNIESMRCVSLERDPNLLYLLVNLVLVLQVAVVPPLVLPLVLHLVSLLCVNLPFRISPMHPTWHGNPAHFTTGNPTL